MLHLTVLSVTAVVSYPPDQDRLRVDGPPQE